MAHHIGDPDTSMAWARANNDLIRRVVDLYPENFVGGAQLPQVAGEPLSARQPPRRERGHRVLQVTQVRRRRACGESRWPGPRSDL